MPLVSLPLELNEEGECDLLFYKRQMTSHIKDRAVKHASTCRRRDKKKSYSTWYLSNRLATTKSYHYFEAKDSGTTCKPERISKWCTTTWCVLHWKRLEPRRNCPHFVNATSGGNFRYPHSHIPWWRPFAWRHVRDTTSMFTWSKGSLLLGRKSKHTSTTNTHLDNHANDYNE